MLYADRLLRRRNSLCVAAVLSIGLNCASAMAAPFQDLDFEQAMVQPDPSSPVGDEGPLSAAAAFPGWVVTDGDMVSSYVLGRALPLDGTFVGLVFPDVDGPTTTDFAPQGQYAAILSGNADPLLDYPTTASLSQTGDVPAGAASIQFMINNAFATSDAKPVPLFSVNGISIPVYPVATSGTSELWAGDIAPYAGTTATITFTAAGVSKYSTNDDELFVLDAISFSSQPVPEPSVAVYAVLSCVALLIPRRRCAKGADRAPSAAC